MASIYRNPLSFLISCRLWKCWLQLCCLLIAFFHYSIRCPYREIFCPRKPIFKTPLLFSAGCTGSGMLSQANIYRPEWSARVGPYNERSLCTFARPYLASQHLHRLEPIDLGSTTKWGILSGIVTGYCQKLSVVNCLAPPLCLQCSKYTWTVLTVTLLLLFQDQKLVWESRSKQSRIGFHNNFVNAKDALL